MKTLLALSVAVLVFATSSPARAQVSPEGAASIAKQTSSLFTPPPNRYPNEYIETIVYPTKGRDMVIVHCTKKLVWFGAVIHFGFCATKAVVDYFKNHPESSVEEIWLTDRGNMRGESCYYSIKLSDAVAVHKQLSAGSIDSDEARQMINKVIQSRLDGKLPPPFPKTEPNHLWLIRTQQQPH